EGDGGIVKETQRVFFAGLQAQEEIVSRAAGFSTAPLAAVLLLHPRDRALRLVKGQASCDDGVVSALDEPDQSRFEGEAAFARQIDDMTGAAQQALHLARPVLFLDFD